MVGRNGSGKSSFAEALERLLRDLEVNAHKGQQGTWSPKDASKDAKAGLKVCQDTDPLQAQIAFLLAEDPKAVPAADWRGVHLAPGKLFVVGEPNQYG